MPRETSNAPSSATDDGGLPFRATAAGPDATSASVASVCAMTRGVIGGRPRTTLAWRSPETGCWIRWPLRRGVPPKSAWVLGQLVAYLGEAGRWTKAEEFARACSVVESWWCAGLLGFVLHAKGRYTEAEKAFRRALDTTESAERERWLDPEVLLDAAGSDVLDDTWDLGHASERRLLALLWSFADPLYLVEGNDRLTEALGAMDAGEGPRGRSQPVRHVLGA